MKQSVMNAPPKAKILIVDDQPSKLLSLDAILSVLGEAVVKANSAEDALKILLDEDIAVVLMDICMPGMDGFALAELIRNHPRFARTAIIFISAVHLSEADCLRGYSLGAVDYIPVPVVPEILRAKVAVFVELYKKSDQLARLNRELEQRVAHRTVDLEASNARLRESERRYRDLAHALPAAVYTTDVNGRVTLYNQAAVDLWGRTPEIGVDKWCGSSRILRSNGESMPFEDCPMAVALRTGRAVRGVEITIERPDGSRRTVLPHPELMLDDRGAIIGAVNMLVDVTEQKAAERARRESEERFRTLADNISQLVCVADGEGQVLWLNKRWLSYAGAAPEDLAGWGWTWLLHPEHADRAINRLRESIRAGAPWEDTLPIRGKTGEYRWFLSHGFPMTEHNGVVVRWFCTCTDVTDQREAQQVLSRDRETLENIVAERTEELRRASQQLRLADRLTAMGALSAGLGHDIGNLLLPVRMRLDAIESHDLPSEVREDVGAIRTASEYLQRLARSLRLLAIDPESERVEDLNTDIAEWWSDAQGMIRNGVRRPTILTASVPPDLPRAHIGKAALTQIVFNLVQNSGDALCGREDGRVLMEVVPSDDGLILSVTDNGPGMPDHARERCTEPFFTTKTREIGAGLGLALVSGLLNRVGGAMEIQTAPGAGTTVILRLPIAARPDDAAAQPVRRVALVTLSDRRLRAHVDSILAAHRVEVRHEPANAPHDLWITDSADAAASNDPCVIQVDPDARPSVLRAKINEAVRAKSITSGSANAV